MGTKDFMYHLGSNENLRGVADVRPGAGCSSGTALNQKQLVQELWELRLQVLFSFVQSSLEAPLKV